MAVIRRRMGNGLDDPETRSPCSTNRRRSPGTPASAGAVANVQRGVGAARTPLTTPARRSPTGQRRAKPVFRIRGARGHTSPGPGISLAAGGATLRITRVRPPACNGTSTEYSDFPVQVAPLLIALPRCVRKDRPQGSDPASGWRELMRQIHTRPPCGPGNGRRQSHRERAGRCPGSVKKLMRVPAHDQSASTPVPALRPKAQRGECWRRRAWQGGSAGRRASGPGCGRRG